MTKEEAQEIIDKIDPTTVVDDCWLDYLINDREFLILRAIYVIFDMDYNSFHKKYEGYEMKEFQNKKEIYVGKTIKYLNNYYLLVGQDKMYVWYFNIDGDICFFKINEIKNYLI